MKKLLLVLSIALMSTSSFATVECEKALDVLYSNGKDVGMLEQHIRHLDAQIMQYQSYLSHLYNNPRLKSYMGYTREQLVELIRRIEENKKPQLELLAQFPTYIARVKDYLKKECRIVD